jgi:hypothetical protein
MGNLNYSQMDNGSLFCRSYCHLPILYRKTVCFLQRHIQLELELAGESESAQTLDYPRVIPSGICQKHIGNQFLRNTIYLRDNLHQRQMDTNFRRPRNCLSHHSNPNRNNLNAMDHLFPMWQNCLHHHYHLGDHQSCQHSYNQ